MRGGVKLHLQLARRVLAVVTALLIGIGMLSACGGQDEYQSTVPYSQWTECPAQPRFSLYKWKHNERVNGQMLEYAVQNHCTFSFVGSKPADAVWDHNHPGED